MIQLLEHVELKLVSAADGACVPDFSLKGVGEMCATGGVSGKYIYARFDSKYERSIECTVYCQGRNIGRFSEGMTASCMPGEMIQIASLSDHPACVGTASFIYA